VYLSLTSLVHKQAGLGQGGELLPDADARLSSLEPLRSMAVWVLVLRLTLRFKRLATGKPSSW